VPGQKKTNPQGSVGVIAICSRRVENAVQAGAAPAPTPRCRTRCRQPRRLPLPSPRMRRRHGRTCRARARREAGAHRAAGDLPYALAKRIGAEKGSIYSLRAAGPNGSIVKADVESAKPVPPCAGVPLPPRERRPQWPLPQIRSKGSRYSWRRRTSAAASTAVRKVIARRMLESKLTCRQFD